MRIFKTKDKYILGHIIGHICTLLLSCYLFDTKVIKRVKICAFSQ